MSIWKKKEVAKEIVQDISKRYSCELLTASILSRRGIIEGKDILYFTENDQRYLHNPFLFENMEDAVDRILDAKDEEEKVLIFGDRDVDGILHRARRARQRRGVLIAMPCARYSGPVPESGAAGAAAGAESGAAWLAGDGRENHPHGRQPSPVPYAPAGFHRRHADGHSGWPAPRRQHAAGADSGNPVPASAGMRQPGDERRHRHARRNARYPAGRGAHPPAGACARGDKP